LSEYGLDNPAFSCTMPVMSNKPKFSIGDTVSVTLKTGKVISGKVIQGSLPGVSNHVYLVSEPDYRTWQTEEPEMVLIKKGDRRS